MSGFVPGGGGSGGGQIPGDTPTPDNILTHFQQGPTAQVAGAFDILSYTVPNDGYPYHLMLAEFGGTNVAKYTLLFGATVQARSATWHSGPLVSEWDYRGPPGGLWVAGGTIIKITGSHNRPDPGDFWGRLTLLKVN